MSRWLRLAATVVVTALATAYLLWKIDVGETLQIVTRAHPAYLLLCLATLVLTVPPMAWRWQLLLRSQGIRERIPWLVRAYFVAYAAGQILPTSIGGDGMRIFETSRRHAGRVGVIAGSVLLERAIGGVATLALAGVGFALALGRYDVGAYLWLEGLFVAGSIVLGVVFFSRSLRRPLARLVPLLRRLRAERVLRGLYEGVHAFRGATQTLVAVTLVTLIVQVIRIFGIWATGKAVGVDLSPRVYFVMGPLLFLVMLVPFTLNGFAVREAFFVSFLGGVGVDADAAFAIGFLYFVLTIVLALPGAIVLGWEGIRSARPARAADG